MSSTPDRQSQTEAPTKRRLEQARNRGDVAKSADLTGGLGRLATSTMLIWAGDVIGDALQQTLRHGLTNVPQEISIEIVNSVITENVSQLAAVVGVFLVAIAATHLAIVLVQVGFGLSLESIQPNWNRINPVNGLSRLFSTQSVARGGIAIIKVSVMVAVLVTSIRSRLTAEALLSHDNITDAVSFNWNLVLHTSLVVSLALVATGFIDYAYQRWQHDSKLRMTKQEVKDERKDEEGDPFIRARVKRVQRELSQGRMLKDVANATVVLTNPTHYSIALAYDTNSSNAPRVVAKGVDEVAKRIREIAAEHDVPMVERRELARALYRSVEVGREISPELYHAVAEVVAYLMRIGRFQIVD